MDLFSADLPLPKSKVFLKRNKKAVMKAKEFSIELEQHMTSNFSPSTLRMKYRSGATDTLHRLGPTKQQKVE
jgi:hypothetical protein